MGGSASESPSVSPSSSPSVSPSPSPSVSPSPSPSRSPSKSPSISPSASPSPMPAAHITYTIHGGNDGRIRIGKKYIIWANLAFTTTTNDLYPSGGMPLTNSSLGLRNNPNSVKILESAGDAYLYEWDRSANTIRIFSEARVELTIATAVPTFALEVEVIGW